MLDIKIPFTVGSNYFEMTELTAENIKNKIINLVSTNKNERIFNNDFGTNIQKLLFENIQKDDSRIKTELIISFTKYIPEVEIDNVIINDVDENQVNITIEYHLKNNSNINDEITIGVVT